MPSSVIKSFDYDQDSAVLLITFVSGLKYKYMNVPPEVFAMLKAAGSKGRYFNHHIRNKFKYRKIRNH
ncbi:KTSC domain-containing protein [Pedobacter steynii]|uniref:KTSC domain-containing protein n=1 Tax=Pedobacter steynii TaxID=430522 RepID=A0A1D7QLB9_9SPHI|nr:KTSC domain-containing protein [Pedobacter steynii]AOM79476.1 KTSC domain-containing protein [Pedobacter steynii]